MAYRSLDLTSAENYVQDINNSYVKTKQNYDIYESIEIISELIESTNQKKSALNSENAKMVVKMKSTNKIIEKWHGKKENKM